jgi:chromosome segregation protein
VYIKEIELRNFKTFQRGRIQFTNEFIAVSGPNGSGKSNIIDAIIFCLGLSSSRTMRAEKLTDLIHKVEGRPKPDFAGVTIKFDGVDMDEVTIRRRIRETAPGKYYSTYYLNDRVCNLSDIHNHLAEANISPDGHNMVMQGEIMQIVEMSPIERRLLIDEIAGVAEFDERKRCALEELDKVKRKIEDVDLILGMLDGQLKRLQKEKEEALKYEELRREKLRYEGLQLLLRVRSLQKELQSNDRKRVAKEEEWESLDGKRRKVEEEIGVLSSQLEELEAQIKEKDGDKVLNIRKGIESMKEEIGKKKNSIVYASREITDAESQQKELLARLGMGLDRIKEVEFDAGLNEKQKRLDGLRKIVNAAKLDRNSLQMDIERCMDASRRKAGDIEDICREIDAAVEQTKKQEEEKRKMMIKLEAFRMELSTLKEKNAELERERTQIDAERAELDVKLRHLQREYAKNEAIITGAREGEHGAAVRAIREAAKRKELKGIYGTITDLGKVDKEFALALEIAAGHRMECIVTDTDEDAIIAIDYLKRAKAGRATFLPLTKMRGRSTSGRCPKDKGIIDYAINLVEYDEKFDAAFGYIFGDTLVVDSLENARKYINRFRMVTLEGELMERSGAMTGGTMRSKYRFALVKDEDDLLILKKEIAGQEEKLKIYTDDLRKMDTSVMSIKRRITEIENNINRKELEYSNISSTLENLRMKVASKKTLSEEIKNETDDVLHLIASLKREKEGKERFIQRCGKELEGMERSMELEEGIRRYENLEKAARAARERRESYENEVKELEWVLDELRDKEQRIVSELGDLRDLREKKIVALSQLNNKVSDLKRRAERACDELSYFEHRRNEILSTLEGLRDEIEKRDVKEVESSQRMPSYNEIIAKLTSMEKRMQSMEPVNMKAITEHDSIASRRNEMRDKRDTLAVEREEIIRRIEGCKKAKGDAFMDAFDGINNNFKEIFAELSDGYGELNLENPKNPFEGGLLINAQPAGKTPLRLEARSGGERSLIVLSFLLAIQQYKPAPFYAFDEVDMHLDGANVEKVARMIKRCAKEKETQFIVVSIREPMIEAADRTIGVVMQENDRSMIMGVILNA